MKQFYSSFIKSVKSVSVNKISSPIGPHIPQSPIDINMSQKNNKIAEKLPENAYDTHSLVSKDK